MAREASLSPMGRGYAPLMSTSPRMWTSVGAEGAAAICQHLLEQGGQEAPSVGPHESRRIRLQGATVTMFGSATMYFTTSAAAGPLVAAALALTRESLRLVLSPRTGRS
jgi:hypothetical protein